MTVHKRYTNKAKTKISWGYWATIPSNKFDIHGNPIRKQVTKFGFATKKEAQKAEKEFFANFESGKIELNKNATFNDVMMFFFDYIEKEGKYAKGTIANYKGLNNKHLEFFKLIRVDKITPEIIRSWRKERCEANISDYRLNDCIKLIKAAFNYAKREKQITANPFEDMKKVSLQPKLRKRFSTGQLKQLLDSCKSLMPEYYCLFALSFMTGMRVGEYSALTINDIDFENNSIYVEKQFTRGELKNRNKTPGSTRIVHLSKVMSAILKWHIQEFHISSGLLFKDINNKPVSAKWVSRKFKKLLNQNGYDENYCRVHDLRGQYVDIMHSCGIPTEYISREVGHSNTATTSNIYTQILDEVPVEANRKMDEKLFG